MTAHPARSRRSRRETESSEFVALLIRLDRALAHRIVEDPAILVHLPDLRASRQDAVSEGIYLANVRGLSSPYSMNEIARAAGVTRQAVQQQVHRGEAIRRRIESLAGPVVRLADVRARRAERLRSVGIADVTGSPRERAAGDR